ncbi:MAG: DUF1284 domain-containing protein [Bilifractor sp.]
MTEDMKMRPHHLLCTQGYEGKGYDKTFVEHMSMYVRRMRSEPSFRIRITLSPDDLCAACPHLADPEHCSSDDKVRTFDRKVMDFFGLEDGRSYCYQDLVQTIDRKMTEAKLYSICGTCAWYPVSQCRARILHGVWNAEI